MERNINNFVQVPVINKTESLFLRNPNNLAEVTGEMPEMFKTLLNKEEPLVTVKTDGTCGILVKDSQGYYYLMRRQDIKVGSRNYKMVMDNGTMTTFSNLPCFQTQMVRGGGKSEKVVPLYIFQIAEDGKPEVENTHIIGFTPLLHDFGDDKYAITAIDGSNCSKDMKLYTTVYENSLDIPVKSIPAAQLLQDKNVMTVEILGSKISNKYGFKDDRHFINPHGSIVYPKEMCPELNYDSLRIWFENDATNRWSNVEGLVIHFPLSNKRFKVHRGHVGMEKSWMYKKNSGIVFNFE
ncbi:hypothetical protein QJ856_gp0172 [Tupanvirus deep ocean]|uniref:Uncharacterized protein n=2 Tax=Tupanvirus TaxID=2094720 RepID=A0AC62A9X2_9VIRU|nr:hypothetical protein QJ856_gp0172 [Tupanvirus deep ocean]QKU34556.1 hypothetical protein [Tupanvirus deep ocean]